MAPIVDPVRDGVTQFQRLQVSAGRTPDVRSVVPRVEAQAVFGAARGFQAGQERGASLVETVVALGLFTFVLLSAASLFVIGGRQIRSGRAATQALSVARWILEESERLGPCSAALLYGVDGSLPSGVADMRTNPLAARWRGELERHLPGAGALVEVASLEGDFAPSPLDRASGTRILVTVVWTEGERERRVSLGTVRL